MLGPPSCIAIGRIPRRGGRRRNTKKIIKSFSGSSSGRVKTKRSPPRVRLLHDEAGLRRHAGRGPLGHGRRVLRQEVGRVAGRDAGEGLARPGRNGRVRRGRGERRRRLRGGRRRRQHRGRLGRGARGFPPGLGDGGGAAAGLAEEGGGGGEPGPPHRRVLGPRAGRLREPVAGEQHLLQLLDLHPPQVGQRPVALVAVDEGVQGHVAVQERVGHVLGAERDSES